MRTNHIDSGFDSFLEWLHLFRASVAQPLKPLQAYCLGHFFRRDSACFRIKFRIAFLIDFGSPQGAPGDPPEPPKTAQEGPKVPQGASQDRPGRLEGTPRSPKTDF